MKGNEQAGVGSLRAKLASLAASPDPAAWPGIEHEYRGATHLGFDTQVDLGRVALAFATVAPDVANAAVSLISEPDVAAKCFHRVCMARRDKALQLAKADPVAAIETVSDLGERYLFDVFAEAGPRLYGADPGRSLETYSRLQGNSHYAASFLSKLSESFPGAAAELAESFPIGGDFQYVAGRLAEVVAKADFARGLSFCDQIPDGDAKTASYGHLVPYTVVSNVEELFALMTDWRFRKFRYKLFTRYERLLREWCDALQTENEPAICRPNGGDTEYWETLRFVRRIVEDDPAAAFARIRATPDPGKRRNLFIYAAQDLSGW